MAGDALVNDGDVEDPGSDCPVGEQDEDGDGACLASCAQKVCGPNRGCDDSSGLARCVFDLGFQDDDGNGSCWADRSLVTCQDNASCSSEADLAECECDFGYQDPDGDGVCELGCSENACSGHGACNFQDGVVLTLRGVSPRKLSTAT